MASSSTVGPLARSAGSVELAQRQGKVTVALYRKWWEEYDRRTQGLQAAEPEAEPTSSPYLVIWLGLVLLALCLLVVVRCETGQTSLAGSVAATT